MKSTGTRCHDSKKEETIEDRHAHDINDYCDKVENLLDQIDLDWSPFKASQIKKQMIEVILKKL